MKRSPIAVLIILACVAGSTLAASEVGPLPNFATVDPGLYRGAAPKPEGLTTLKSMGVRTVIDLRISPKLVAEEKARVQALGMTFINIPMGSDPPTPAQQAQFLALTANPKASPTFVHCQHGADRTGTMLGIYREVHDGWSYDRAYKEMRRYGFKPWYTQLAAAVKARSRM